MVTFEFCCLVQYKGIFDLLTTSLGEASGIVEVDRERYLGQVLAKEVFQDCPEADLLLRILQKR